MGEELGVKLKEYEEKIYEIVGELFNINFLKQFGVILFEKIGLFVVKKIKIGYLMFVDVFEKLVDKYDIVDYILQYR